MPTFCLASRSDNTVRQYKYAFNSFCKWCLSHKITQTLPSFDIYVSMYLIHLTNIGKSVSTINETYYSISWAHRLAGDKNLCNSDLVITVKERAHRSIGHLTVKKEPITSAILHNLVCVYDDEHANLKHIRIACMCLLSYAGFLRYSELSNLMRNHVTFYEQHIKLFLECSNTDVYREGRDVLIFKTDNSTWPVNMLSRYCVLANITPDSTDYLFRPLCFYKSTKTYTLRQG